MDALILNLLTKHPSASAGGVLTVVLVILLLHHIKFKHLYLKTHEMKNSITHLAKAKSEIDVRQQELTTNVENMKDSLERIEASFTAQFSDVFKKIDGIMTLLIKEKGN